MQSRKNLAPRRKAARRSPALSLSARVERLEKALLFAAPAAAVPTQRFTKIGADGRPTTAAHVAVHDAKTGLVWAAEPLQGGNAFTHAEAMKACADLDLFGHKDWRAPTIEELLSIVDYSRADPAMDADLFKGPYGWAWSSTVAAAPAGCAWFVTLGGGDSVRYFQVHRGHVRAVRAGQQLGLSV